MAFEQRDIDYVDSLSITNYLNRTNGFTFKRVGQGSLVCEQHDSLIVRDDDKHWYWNSQATGGIGVVGWKMKIEGYSWKDAVTSLLKDNGRYSPIAPSVAVQGKEKEKKPFVLPKPADNNYRAAAYLIKTRGLDPYIVNECMKKGLIYEDERHNVVVVGRDKDGKAKSADRRSTRTYGERFRGSVGGSDKRYGFALKSETKEERTLFVFEAWIDALSFCTLRNMSAKARGNRDYYKRFNVLALNGNVDTALEQYLKDNPKVERIVLKLDNDEGGRKGTERILNKYGKDYDIVSQPVVKGYDDCKDVNEVLLSFRQKLNQEKPSKLAKARTNERAETQALTTSMKEKEENVVYEEESSYTRK